MKSLYKEESIGSHGEFHLEITVGASAMPDLKIDAIQNAAYKAAAFVKAEVMAAVVATSPKEQVRASEERSQLIGLFNETIYTEEIPNGYCSDWCCRHLPWFVVTTRMGRFKIGWRKRVINIDWSDTRGTKTAKELFPDEDVTKGERMIHAWSIENARRYIETVSTSSVSNGTEANPDPGKQKKP